MRLPLRSLDWRDWLAVVLAVLLVLVGLRWLRLPGLVGRARQARAAARQGRISLERRRLAEQAERNQAPVALTYQVERYAPLDDQAIEDAASLLGRLFHAVASDDLNVPATVRTSIDAGGRLIPVYADRPVARDLTVLVDVERGDHPWLAGITWVLERWQALGVRFARFDFRFDPSFVTAHATGNAGTLQYLARHVDGGPLVVISRTLSTQGYRESAGWLEEIEAWPVKAWLDPDPRPLGERRRERQEIRRLEQQHGLQRFPFSAAGLLALARYLAEDGQGVPSPAWPALRPLDHAAVAEALPRWALLAALVPDATWDQLEAIRRHFPELSRAFPEPRYVQRLLDWVAREDHELQPESEDGRTLVLSQGLVDRLIRQQRRLDAGQPRMQQLEVRGRQLLLQQLDATRPDDELLGQFWELKRVSHRLYLEPEQALAMVAPLLGSAVEPELFQVVETELAREDVSPRLEPGVRDRLDLMVGRAVGQLQPGALLGRPWRAWGVPALVTLGAMLLAGLLIWYGPAGLHTWLRRPPHARVTTVVSLAIQSVVKQSVVKPMTVTNSIGMTFVLIPPGEFRMGSDDKEAYKDEKPVHTVRLTQAFFLGKYEVTQGQWQAVMGMNPSLFPGDANRPVEQVSWDNVQGFIRRLNAQEGGAQYRLPTEAEWEYAARAGTTTAYSFGNDARQLGEYAWYDNNADGKTHPVGQKKPNAWGLHDMYGNVWEWVQDWYTNYAAGSAVDPAGPSSGSLRVVRGGSWVNGAGEGRSAARGLAPRLPLRQPRLPPAEDGPLTLGTFTLLPCGSFLAWRSPGPKARSHCFSARAAGPGDRKATATRGGAPGRRSALERWLLLEGAYNAKPDIRGAIGGGLCGASRIASRMDGLPGASPDDLVCRFLSGIERSLRLWAGGRRRVSVPHPLGHIPGHVIEEPGIWLQTSHRRDRSISIMTIKFLRPSWRVGALVQHIGIATDLVIRVGSGIALGGVSARRVLPLCFRRQPVALAGGVVPGYFFAVEAIAGRQPFQFRQPIAKGQCFKPGDAHHWQIRGVLRWATGTLCCRRRSLGQRTHDLLVLLLRHLGHGYGKGDADLHLVLSLARPTRTPHQERAGRQQNHLGPERRDISLARRAGAFYSLPRAYGYYPPWQQEPDAQE